MPTHTLDKLAAAKLWLITDTPTSGSGELEGPPGMTYLAHALYALVPVLSTDIEQMTIDDSWRVYVDPGWLDEADVPEVAAQLAHVVWHLLLDHAGRAGDQHVDATTAAAWGQAGDITVAHTLGRTVPHHLPDGRDLAPRRGSSAEEFFAVLSRLPATTEEPSEGSPEVTGGCGSGADGLRREHELPRDADASVDLEDARLIRRRVAIEYRDHCARHPGSQPGDAWRWAKQILEPTVPWGPLLAGAVRRAAGWVHGHAEYTYTRPSRRSGAVPGVVLPATRRPLPTVAMVVDTSGSVDDVLLGRALGEVDGAVRALGVADEAVTVLACDAAVGTVARVRRSRDVRLSGGGGTDMRQGITAASALRPRPDVIVVLTDGWTPWPPQPPGSVVVAAILGRDRRQLPPTPSWATRVECLLDE